MIDRVPCLIERQTAVYQSRHPTRRWLHETRRLWVTEAVRRYAPARGGHALEVGPGSGTYLSFLAGLFENLSVSDESVEVIQYIKTILPRPGISTIVDDLSHSRLPSHTFDLILCSEVLEHIPGGPKAIGELHRLLKPGGILILTTPQPYSLLELMMKAASWPVVHPLVEWFYGEPIPRNEHLYTLSGKRVTACLKGSGFQIRERFSSGMYLPLVAELCGRWGVWLERALETRFRGGPLDGLLWTQYVVAQA